MPTDTSKAYADGEMEDEVVETYYIIIFGDVNGDGAINLSDIQYLMQNDKNVISILKENGDFRSAECIELLKQSDIVVTNPPFSLFRDFQPVLH